MNPAQAKSVEKRAKNNWLTHPAEMVFIVGTSLLAVSTAGRGAVLSGAAPAYFQGSFTIAGLA